MCDWLQIFCTAWMCCSNLATKVSSRRAWDLWWAFKKSHGLNCNSFFYAWLHYSTTLISCAACSTRPLSKIKTSDRKNAKCTKHNFFPRIFEAETLSCSTLRNHSPGRFVRLEVQIKLFLQFFATQDLGFPAVFVWPCVPRHYAFEYIQRMQPAFNASH